MSISMCTRVCTYLYYHYLSIHNYKNPAFIPRLPVLLHCLRVYPILLLFYVCKFHFWNWRTWLLYAFSTFTYLFNLFSLPAMLLCFVLLPPLGMQDLGFPTRDRGYSFALDGVLTTGPPGKCLCPSFKSASSVHWLCPLADPLVVTRQLCQFLASFPHVAVSRVTDGTSLPWCSCVKSFTCPRQAFSPYHAPQNRSPSHS